MTGTEGRKPDSMLDELLQSTNQPPSTYTGAVSGVQPVSGQAFPDPLSAFSAQPSPTAALSTTAPATPYLQASPDAGFRLPDAEPGSAAAVHFASQNAPVSLNPAPTDSNPLASIPGIMLSDAQSSDGWQQGGGVPGAPLPPKKKKEPMRPIDFLKIVGALFLASLIFFGSFLAYVVFNPEQAKFFVEFGINRADIQTLLARLVNGIFGTITFALSIVFFITLFRAIVTKKEYKRKKTVATILAFFFGTVLFSNITFWAFLVQKIGAQDFANPNGGIKIFDNDKLLSEQFKEDSEVGDFNNVIGPATFKYDLSSDASYISKKFMRIESFEIDYDGDGVVDKEGADPTEAQDLIFTYAKKGKYVPKGTYFGKNNVTGEPMTQAMDLPIVNLSAVVNITKTKNGTVFDAKDASLLGSPKWYGSDDLNKPVSTTPVYTEKPTKKEKFLCLALVTNKTKEENCNKIFVIHPDGESPISADISVEKVKDDQFTYRFSLKNVKVRQGWDVANYRWVLDDGSVFCQRESCDYSFSEFGKRKYVLYLTDAAGSQAQIEGEVDIKRPLSILRSEGDQPLLKVLDDSEENLLKDAFDRSIDAYRVERFTVPSKIVFDATDVRVRNPGYELETVEWKFGSDGAEKSGKRIEYEIVRDGRFEVQVRYVFFNRIREERSETSERIVFEGKKRDLVADLTITSDDSDGENFYAPTTIKFDGSASKTKNGSITKFIYDFGLGRAPAEGDAIQTIRYDNPGEYQVSLTVVKDDGSKDTTTRKIVIKDVPKRLVINSSVSSGIVGSQIDFDASDSKGQIETFAWDFGDGTPVSSEPAPSHAFEKPGTYTVKLQARYSDATVKSVDKDIVVKASDATE